MNTDLIRLKLSIKFKNYILSIDVDSRRILIDEFINFMNQTTDDGMQQQCILWLDNLKQINSLHSNERKEQIRFDACWDELLLSLSKSKNFYYLMTHFSV